MLFSITLIRASAVLSALGGIVVLGIGIDLGDLGGALYCIPFFAGSALLWGFSDIINLLHGIHGSVAQKEGGTDEDRPSETAPASTAPRTIKEIEGDLARLKGVAKA